MHQGVYQRQTGQCPRFNSLPSTYFWVLPVYRESVAQWQEAQCGAHGRWFDPSSRPTKPSIRPLPVDWYQKGLGDPPPPKSLKSLYRAHADLMPLRLSDEVRCVHEWDWRPRIVYPLSFHPFTLGKLFETYWLWILECYAVHSLWISIANLFHGLDWFEIWAVRKNISSIGANCSSTWHPCVAVTPLICTTLVVP